MNLNQIVWLDFDYKNKHYECEAIPSLAVVNSSQPPAFDIYFNNEYNGTILKDDNEWVSDIDNALVKIISCKLLSFFNA
ncbi:MAG: hypothetical protein ABI405_04255 [Parafilimonas sp.]